MRASFFSFFSFFSLRFAAFFSSKLSSGAASDMVGARVGTDACCSADVAWCRAAGASTVGLAFRYFATSAFASCPVTFHGYGVKDSVTSRAHPRAKGTWERSSSSLSAFR